MHHDDDEVREQEEPKDVLIILRNEHQNRPATLSVAQASFSLLFGPKARSCSALLLTQPGIYVTCSSWSFLLACLCWSDLDRCSRPSAKIVKQARAPALGQLRKIRLCVPACSKQVQVN